MGHVFALLLSCAGLACLYGSWRRLPLLGKHHTLTLVAGWGLLLLSAVCWLQVSPVEFGLPYFFLALPLLAWLLILCNYELRRHKIRAVNGGELVLPRVATVGRHLLLFVIAVPLAAVAAAVFTTALVTLLPWKLGNALVLDMLLMPFVWGAAACWVCADSRLLRPTAALCCALLGGALLLWQNS